jgi:threonine dehydrogenase-like Zn-dependent dehydrogenase
MKALILKKVRDLVLEEIPYPSFTGKGAILKVKSASICATDLKIYNSWHFKIKEGQERILGHEIFGEIIEISEEFEKEIPKGSNVFVAPNIGCGKCDFCLVGKYNLCPNYDAFGITLDGAFAEYMYIPEKAIIQGNVIPIEGKISDELIPLVEPLATCLYTLNNLDINMGDTVLVIGAGFMGLLNAITAKMAGASLVVSMDIRDERLNIARKIGIDYTINSEKEDVDNKINELTYGRKFDIVIVTVPLSEIQEKSINLVTRMGKINFFAGLPSGSTTPSINTNIIHYQQLTITGSTGADILFYKRSLKMINYRKDLQEKLRKLITSIVSLEEAKNAFERALEGKELKVVIKINK